MADAPPPARGLRAALRAGLAAADAVALRMALGSGALFLLVSFYITVDVLGRKFLGVSSAVTDEMGGYALALGGVSALAYTLRTGGHVRIDVLLPHLPRRVRVGLGYAALAVMALFAAVVAVYAWRLALDSYRTDARAMSFLRTPLVIPQACLALGLSGLALEALLMLAVGLVDSLAAGRLVELEDAPGPAAPQPGERA